MSFDGDIWLGIRPEISATDQCETIESRKYWDPFFECYFSSPPFSLPHPYAFKLVPPQYGDDMGGDTIDFFVVIYTVHSTIDNDKGLCDLRHSRASAV